MDSKTSTPASTITNTYTSGIKQSSISVAVRVRPFTDNENNRLVKLDDDDFFLGDGCFTDGNANNNNNNVTTNNTSSANSITKQKFLNQSGIRKIVNVVDDRMLIFDPPETNPLAKMQKNAFPNSFKGSRIREHKFVLIDYLMKMQVKMMYIKTQRGHCLIRFWMDTMPLFLHMELRGVVRRTRFWALLNILELSS